MNWRRGFIRIWVVGSVVWVGLIGLIRWEDAVRVTPVGTITLRGAEGSTFRFPVDASESEILEALSKHYGHEPSQTAQKPASEDMKPWCRYGSQDLSCDNTTLEQQRAISAARQRARQQMFTEQIKTAFNERRALTRELATLAVGPPIAFLLVGLVLAWIIRGFRAPG
jgi:hypothetical protein